jgi:hypothetical protein
MGSLPHERASSGSSLCPWQPSIWRHPLDHPTLAQGLHAGENWRCVAISPPPTPGLAQLALMSRKLGWQSGPHQGGTRLLTTAGSPNPVPGHQGWVRAFWGLIAPHLPSCLIALFCPTDPSLPVSASMGWVSWGGGSGLLLIIPKATHDQTGQGQTPALLLLPMSHITKGIWWGRQEAERQEAEERAC